VVSVVNFESSIIELATVHMAAYGALDLTVGSIETKGEGE
jgi:hypothetical protein